MGYTAEEIDNEFKVPPLTDVPAKNELCEDLSRAYIALAHGINDMLGQQEARHLPIAFSRLSGSYQHALNGVAALYPNANLLTEVTPDVPQDV